MYEDVYCNINRIYDNACSVTYDEIYGMTYVLVRSWYLVRMKCGVCDIPNYVGLENI